MSSSGCHPGDFSPYNQQKGDRKGKSGEETEHPLNFMQEKKKGKEGGEKKLIFWFVFEFGCCGVKGAA